MKSLVIFLPVFFFPWYFSGQQRPNPTHFEIIQVKVTRVVDGDTVLIGYPRRQTSAVRLLFIDAPESDQSDIFGVRWGQISTSWLRRKVEGRNVRIELHGQDFYGRLLGVIWLQKEEINLSSLQKGFSLLSQWMGQASKTQQSRYFSAMYTAQLNLRGVWSARGLMRPDRHRKKR